MEFPYRVGAVTPLFLAPMAGVSEAPFRQVCRRFRADGVVPAIIFAGGGGRGHQRGPADVPVTVKTGSGWDETQRDPVTIALRCREAGAQALTLHARTRTQMFTGKANWDEIARVVEALDVPVIGNGDVYSAADVLAMKQHTNCAGIMIARGAFGNPWIFQQGRALLAGLPEPPPPTPQERFATALAHARLALRLQGDTRKTALEFRKHFGWYTKGVPGASQLRERLFQIESMAEAQAVFAGYLATREVEAAA